MAEHAPKLQLGGDVPALSLDYPGVLRAWAQMGGEVDLKVGGSGGLFNDPEVKWDKVPSAVSSEEEAAAFKPLPLLFNRHKNDVPSSLPTNVMPHLCSSPNIHVGDGLFIGGCRNGGASLMNSCNSMPGIMRPLYVQGQTHLGISPPKPTMYPGLMPQLCTPFSFLSMEPLSLGKVGISGAMVPVSAGMNMNRHTSSQPLKTGTAEQKPLVAAMSGGIASQPVPAGLLPGLVKTLDCGSPTMPPTSWVGPPCTLPCSKGNPTHTVVSQCGNPVENDGKDRAQTLTRLQLDEMKGWKGRFRTRKQSLQRYMEKKARRLQTKKIRYELRKINADRRPRIKGRFAKKEQLEEYLRSQRAEINC